MNKLISSPPYLLSAKRKHMSVTVCLRDTCLKMVSCVCLKVLVRNCLSRSHMREVSCDTFELTKL